MRNSPSIFLSTGTVLYDVIIFRSLQHDIKFIGTGSMFRIKMKLSSQADTDIFEHPDKNVDSTTKYYHHRQEDFPEGRNKIMIVATLTFCWYFSSSMNAVGTQRAVQEIYNKKESIGPESYPIRHRNVAVMTSLTAMQLIAGLCIAKILSWVISSLYTSSHEQGKMFSAATVTTTATTRISTINTSNITSSKRLIAATIGFLHYFGCLFTNLSFAYGSATVVQVVKLLEPVETLFLTFILNTFSFNIFKENANQQITSLKICSVIVIIAGTSLLLLSTGIEHNAVNFYSITFALCSGFAMSSRNVAQQTTKERLVNKDCTMENNIICRESWVRATIVGLNNFIQITSYAILPSLMTLLLIADLSLFEATEGGRNIIWWSLMSMVKSGIQAILYHGLFNIASISVLSLTTALTHSLLNVGKRLSNIIVALIVFRRPLGLTGVSGLCIAAMGGIIYSKAGQRNKATKNVLGYSVAYDAPLQDFSVIRNDMYAGSTPFNVMNPD